MPAHHDNLFVPTIVGEPSRYYWMMCNDREETELFRESLNDKLNALLQERDDVAFLRLLHDAWRHYADQNFLIRLTLVYTKEHGFEDDDDLVETIIAAYSFVPLRSKHWNSRQIFQLSQSVIPHSLEQLNKQLEWWQETDEPCTCPDCVAEAAALN